jgi:hypothetical protein
MNEKLFVIKVAGQLVILTEAQYEYYLIYGTVMK